ncbi:MAG TPA: hypothetical protein VGM54_13465 [Chthoniobacter sp.]|jgi:hypothetical protein
MSDTVFTIIGEAVASVGGAAALIVPLSGWLGKLWAERIMHNETAAHAEKLEKMRKTFTASLHTTRADVIAELFKRLTALQHAAQSHLPGPMSGAERKKSFGECLASAKEQFENNEIYFEPPLCESIADLLTKLDWHNEEKRIDQETQFQEQQDPGRGTRMTARAAYVNESMPKLKKALTDEFRRLLGVVRDSETATSQSFT